MMDNEASIGAAAYSIVLAMAALEMALEYIEKGHPLPDAAHLERIGRALKSLQEKARVLPDEIQRFERLLGAES